VSEKKRAATWVVALSILIGFMAWHVIHWQSTGMYLEMFKWLQTDRGYLTVLYNLGLMLGLGFSLAFLMERIMNLIGYLVHRVKHFE